MKKEKDFRTTLISMIFVLPLAASPFVVRGQDADMSAQTRADLCAGKRGSLKRLEGEAPRIREQIAVREKKLQTLNRYINAASAGRLRSDVMDAYLNSKVALVNSYRFDLRRNIAPQERARIDARLSDEMETMNFFVTLTDMLYKRIPFSESSLRNNASILAWQRELRDLRRRQEYVGSQINILDQSLESLRCSEGRSGNRNVESEESSGEVSQQPEIPDALRGKKVVRTQKQEWVECWYSNPNVPCNEPNLETAITWYQLEGGGFYGDRREYDRKRTEMANAGYKFAWACDKALWRNGRCG